MNEVIENTKQNLMVVCVLYEAHIIYKYIFLTLHLLASAPKNVQNVVCVVTIRSQFNTVVPVVTTLVR